MVSSNFNMFKRRRFNSPDGDVTSSPSHGNFASCSQVSSPSLTGPITKRSRNENHGWNPSHAQQQIVAELRRLVEHQASEIERLKSEKDSVEESVNKLKPEHEKTLNENRILKKAVAIQQERQNQAANEIEAARRYRIEAEERIRKLEQMNLTLRYQLQAQSPSYGNDFMGFSPRPPDVY